MMINLILAAVILIAVGGAIRYIYRSKKNGQVCIGCPNSKQCGKSQCHCNCSENDET